MTEKEFIYYELLALRCKRGDSGAVEELIHTFEKRLFYYIRRLVNNEEDAWEALQETWVKVLPSLHKLREPRKLPAWLYRIARNTAITLLRKEITQRNIVEESDPEAPEANLSNDLDAADAERVHRALTQISFPHREILTLFFLKDLSIEEIADVVDIPVGTVKSRLYHAKRAMREVLEKEGN